MLKLAKSGLTVKWEETQRRNKMEIKLKENSDKKTFYFTSPDSERYLTEEESLKIREILGLPKDRRFQTREEAQRLLNWLTGFHGKNLGGIVLSEPDGTYSVYTLFTNDDARVSVWKYNHWDGSMYTFGIKMNTYGTKVWNGVEESVE